jgi:hypothetical protein
MAGIATEHTSSSQSKFTEQVEQAFAADETIGKSQFRGIAVESLVQKGLIGSRALGREPFAAWASKWQSTPGLVQAGSL